MFFKNKKLFWKTSFSIILLFVFLFLCWKIPKYFNVIANQPETEILNLKYPEENQLVLQQDRNINLVGNVNVLKVNELFINLAKPTQIFFNSLSGGFSQQMFVQESGKQEIVFLVFKRDGKIETVKRHFVFGLQTIFNIGHQRFLLNDQEMFFEKKPFIANNRTLVPLSFVENLDLVRKIGVYQSSEETSFSVYSYDNTIFMTFEIGKKQAFVNGRRYFLDVAPKIDDYVIMVPIRFIAEQLGSKVDWEPHSKQVSVEYPNSR